MGDRTGLPRIDRTNGFDDGRGYMKAKKSKLAQQNEQIRDALRQRRGAMRTELFKGISINVNGRTQPTADELKRVILLNGGEYHPYYRYQQTKFMIATNLSAARVKTLRPDDRVVKPEWIGDSVKANCILPYQDYQLFADEPRGKVGNKASVLALESDSSNHGQSTSNHSFTSNNNSNGGGNNTGNGAKQQATIEQMFQASAARASQTSQLFSSSTTASDLQKQIDNISHVANRNTKNSTTGAPTTATTTTTTTATTNQSKKKPNQQPTMNDFVVRATTKPSQQFPTPKVRGASLQERNVANIIGQTNIDDIVKLINEWVGCSEGITDEDVACVTKYFYDLMSERNYHNKFCEIFNAFKQRTLEQSEECWTNLYNDLARTFKNELSTNADASQNLNLLITYIDDKQDNSDIDVDNINGESDVTID